MIGTRFRTFLCLPIIFTDYYFDEEYILNEKVWRLNVFNIAGELPYKTLYVTAASVPIYSCRVSK